MAKIIFVVLIAASLLNLSTSTMTDEDLYVEEISLNNDFEFLNKVPIMNAQKIFIDPGHGGKDPGASGNGIIEAEKVLEISLKLGAKLQAKGYQVKYSRTNSVYLSLTERANMANKWGADIFLCVHANSFTSPTANGTETFLHLNGSKASRTLATNINNALVNQLGLTNRGVKTADFAVLRLTKMPAVLIETAFVSNANDANKLKSNPQGFANAIASAV